MTFINSTKIGILAIWQFWHFESEIQKRTSYGIFVKIYSVYWTITAMIISSYNLAKWEVN